MFFEPLQLFSTLDSTTKSAPPEVHHADRRKRARSRVHWPVLIFRDSGPEAIEIVTEDLSSTGFFCFSQIAFACGERVTCAIRIPKHDTLGNEQTLTLLCKARVMRVERPSMKATMGIACRIEEYRCWLKDRDWA